MIGVLALQGDVREHQRAVDECGLSSTLVRRPAELAGVDALILPGGESTTMSRHWSPSICLTRCEPGWLRACRSTARVQG